MYFFPWEVFLLLGVSKRMDTFMVPLLYFVTSYRINCHYDFHSLEGRGNHLPVSMLFLMMVMIEDKYYVLSANKRVEFFLDVDF